MKTSSQTVAKRTKADQHEQFSKIPPGDRLRALTVRAIMTGEVCTARPTWTLLDAARVMRDKHVSGLPVVDDTNRVVGVLSEFDILADLDRSVGVGSVRGVLDLLLEVEGRTTLSRLDQCLRRLEKVRVAEVMTQRVVTVDPDASMGEAARLLRAFSARRLPVVEAGHLAGIVTYQNIVDALG